MTPDRTTDPQPEQERLVIRDRRRIDPETGAAREPQEAATPGDPGAGPSPGAVGGDGRGGAATGPDEAVEATRIAELETALAERTSDLQRLQAEYVNYKRRVERDRAAVRDNAIGTVLSALLPVLDDIGRARDHGELEGGFKAVAESFERTVAGLGLVRFGQVGEPFDPRVHEALMHAHADDVAGPTCSAVLQPGYRVGDRILRPARVAVAEPAEPEAGAEPTDPVQAEPVQAEPVEPSYHESRDNA
ncbi:MAG: nucleotide exchange factor GrpE [Actinomycetota bacterium]|nr:nucleotide exchange factor GrpE [Actinomycetota bacterium]